MRWGGVPDISGRSRSGALSFPILELCEEDGGGLLDVAWVCMERSCHPCSCARLCRTCAARWWRCGRCVRVDSEEEVVAAM